MSENINTTKVKSNFTSTIYNGVYNSPLPMFFTSALTLYSGFSKHLSPILLQQTEIKKNVSNSTLQPSKVLKLKVTNSPVYNLLFAGGNALAGVMMADDDAYDGTGLSFVTSTIYLLTNSAYLKNMFIYSRKFGLSLYALNLANACGFGYRFVTNDFKKLSP